MKVSGNGSFGEYWKATRERLDTEFEGQLPLFFALQPPPVVAAIREVLAGGKRLRGCLACLLCDALGGPPAAAIARAMAVECVQAASSTATPCAAIAQPPGRSRAPAGQCCWGT